MEVTYDRRQNIAYIRFRERMTEVDTVRVSDEVNIDLAPDGAFTYEPDPGFAGHDLFTYRAFDGFRSSPPTTVG